MIMMIVDVVAAAVAVGGGADVATFQTHLFFLR